MRKVIAFLLIALSVLSLSADELSIKYDKESLYTKMLVNNTSLRNSEREKGKIFYNLTLRVSVS